MTRSVGVGFARIAEPSSRKHLQRLHGEDCVGLCANQSQGQPLAGRFWIALHGSVGNQWRREGQALDLVGRWGSGAPPYLRSRPRCDAEFHSARDGIGPISGDAEGAPRGVDLATQWAIDNIGRPTAIAIEVTACAISDSTLFLRCGGKKPGNESIVTEAQTFIGRTAEGLKLKDICCMNAVTAKELPNEVCRFMQFCDKFGLVGDAVVIVFGNSNEVVLQSTKRKSKWAEAVQSDAERFAVCMISFQLCVVVGLRVPRTRGLNETFDDDATAVLSSSIPMTNGDFMLMEVASSDVECDQFEE